MMKYLYANKMPCVVFWNGDTDKTILDRLRLTHVRKYLDITTGWH